MRGTTLPMIRVVSFSVCDSATDTLFVCVTLFVWSSWRGLHRSLMSSVYLRSDGSKSKVAQMD